MYISYTLIPLKQIHFIHVWFLYHAAIYCNLLVILTISFATPVALILGFVCVSLSSYGLYVCSTQIDGQFLLNISHKKLKAYVPIKRSRPVPLKVV